MSNILKGLKKVDGKKTGIFAAGIFRRKNGADGQSFVAVFSSDGFCGEFATRN